MQPDSPLFQFHNPDEIASRALRAETIKETVLELQQALLNPTLVEKYSMGILQNGEKNNLLSKLDTALKYNFGLLLSANSGIASRFPTEAKVFEPYESTTSELHPGVEFTTSVIAFDLYGGDDNSAKYNDDDSKPEPKGSLLLFKLGSSEQSPTASDLKLGVNCVFGAVVRDDKIQPFMLKELPNENVVRRFERDDPTSDTGKTIDAQEVQIEKYDAGIKLVMLEGNEREAQEQSVIDELNKFIESQKKVQE